MSATRNPNLGLSQMRMKKRRLFWVRFSIVTFFILFIIFSLAIFSGNEKIIIKEIKVDGQTSVSEEQVLSIVEKNLARRYFYLFSRNNFLIFPRFQIKNDLLGNIKAIKNLDISWNGWQKIKIEIEERKPYAVWCEGDYYFAEGQGCYFLDKNSFIYAKAPTFSGNIFIKNYGQISSPTDPVGQQFLDRITYSKLYNMIHILDEKNLKVVAVISSNSDFKFILESGPEIIFNDNGGFDQQFNNLLTAISGESLDLKKRSDEIKYVDLRFDNKVVIGKKEKNI